MMGKGKLSIGITAELNKIKIQIIDSGRGIAKSKFKKGLGTRTIAFKKNY